MIFFLTIVMSCQMGASRDESLDAPIPDDPIQNEDHSNEPISIAGVLRLFGSLDLLVEVLVEKVNNVQILDGISTLMVMAIQILSSAPTITISWSMVEPILP